MTMSDSVYRTGIIDGTDYDSAAPQGKARVLLSDKNPGILTKPIPVCFPFAGVDKAYFMPKVGDRVIVLLSPNGDDGVIMGALYTKQTTPPVSDPSKHHIAFDDGTTIEYDKAESKLTINCAGEVTVNATGAIALESAVEVTATAPSVTFNGTVQSQFGSGGNLDFNAGQINLN
jgi:phage baseplate assembly protein V